MTAAAEDTWRFGIDQTRREEYAEIGRAKATGRTDLYMARQKEVREQNSERSKTRRRKYAKKARTAPGSEPFPRPLPIPTGGDPRWNDGFLADYARGRLTPVSIPLPDLPPELKWTRPVAEFCSLIIGLRLTVGDRRPSPFGCEWVASHVGCASSTAHRALVTLASEEAGFLAKYDPLPGRKGKRGTAVYGIPGYTVPGTAGLALHDVPVAGFDGGAVPVEAQEVETLAVEPAPKPEDEPGVSHAVGGSPAGMLDGIAASGDGASGLGEVERRGHRRAGYARRPTTQELLERALSGPESARNACFSLACQLRDHGLSEWEAQPVVLDFAARTDLTTRQAVSICGSTYKHPPREPWGAKPGRTA